MKGGKDKGKTIPPVYRHGSMRGWMDGWTGEQG